MCNDLFSTGKSQPETRCNSGNRREYTRNCSSSRQRLHQACNGLHGRLPHATLPPNGAPCYGRTRQMKRPCAAGYLYMAGAAYGYRLAHVLQLEWHCAARHVRHAAIRAAIRSWGLRSCCDVCPRTPGPHLPVAVLPPNPVNPELHWQWRRVRPASRYGYRYSCR